MCVLLDGRFLVNTHELAAGLGCGRFLSGLRAWLRVCCVWRYVCGSAINRYYSLGRPYLLRVCAGQGTFWVC